MARKMTVQLEQLDSELDAWEIVSENTSSPVALSQAKLLARAGTTVRVTIAPFVKAEKESDEDESADEPVIEEGDAPVEIEDESKTSRRGKAA